jgi:hypothetical protein
MFGAVQKGYLVGLCLFLVWTVLFAWLRRVLMRRWAAALVIDETGLCYAEHGRLVTSIPMDRIWSAEYSPVYRHLAILHPDGKQR